MSSSFNRIAKLWLDRRIKKTATEHPFNMQKNSEAEFGVPLSNVGWGKDLARILEFHWQLKIHKSGIGVESYKAVEVRF